VTEKKLNLPALMQERLAYLAAIVAIEAPLKQGQAFSASIPWDTVHKIRAELDEAGWPWRKAHAHRVQLDKQAKAEHQARRESPDEV
jgi:hypothetical protein